MAPTPGIELRTHGYQVLRRPWEIITRDDEIDLKFRNIEFMQCVRPLQVAWEIQECKDDSRDGPPSVVKMTIKDITFWHVEQKR